MSATVGTDCSDPPRSKRFNLVSARHRAARWPRLVAVGWSSSFLLLACGGNGGGLATLPPRVSLVKLTDQDVLVERYLQYVRGAADLDEALVRDGLCSESYSDAEIDSMLDRLATIERPNRFGPGEVTPTLAADNQSVVIVSEVVTNGVKGTLTAHVVREGPGCVDRLSASDPKIAYFLIPGE